MAQAHGPWAAANFCVEAVGLGIDDEVDVALAVERDVLALVPGDRRKAHLGEQVAQLLGSGAAYSTNSKPSVPIGFSRPSGPSSTDGTVVVARLQLLFAGSHCSVVPKLASVEVWPPPVERSPSLGEVGRDAFMDIPAQWQLSEDGKALTQLQIHGFRRGVCIPHPRRGACRGGRPPSRVHQYLEPGRFPADQP